MNKDRRTEPRVETGRLRLLVHDSLAGQVIGSVANLSSKGMLMLGHCHAEVGGTLQLALSAAEAPEQPTIDLMLRINWTHEADTPGNCWIGGRIVGLDQEHTQRLQDLIARLGGASY